MARPWRVAIIARLAELNRPQREAVRHLDGPLLVLAGAGSGKTRVITHKIAHLVRAAGLAPEAIAAVTFTNKAAREMKVRVEKLLGRDRAKGLRVSTFHTLGLAILRREHARTGLRPGFSILDEQDTTTLVGELLRSARLGTGSEAPAVRARIARWKGDGLEEAPAVAGDDAIGAVAAALYRRYAEALATYNAVDFDDLIGLPVRLFRERPEVLAAWQERIRYLLVDEYQDTNLAQYELVRLLAAARGALTAVGDDDQSIYGWRGAHPENLAALARDFPALRIIKLEQSYRSCGNVLAAANALIARNPRTFEKRLWSQRGRGERLRVVVAPDEDGEAAAVAGRLLAQRLASGGRWADYAVLYRGNHQARPLERALRERNVPYVVSGGPSFFDYSEVKDLMAYLRLLVNPADDNAFLRVVNTPRREIGQATVAALAAFAARHGSSLFEAIFLPALDEALGARAAARLREFGSWLGGCAERARGACPVAAVRELLAESRYLEWLRDQAPDPAAAERRAANVEELLGWLERMARQDDEEQGLDALVARLALADVLARDTDDDAGDRVRLMTLHSAKGLEFRHVFLVGMEEGLLPHHSAGDDAAVAEERRLAYVGITRAQDSLTFTLARRRRRWGETRECIPSRFLEELPAELLAWAGDERGGTAPTAAGRATLEGLRALLQ